MNRFFTLAALVVSVQSLAAEPWIPFHPGQSIQLPQIDLQPNSSLIGKTGTVGQISNHCRFQQFKLPTYKTVDSSAIWKVKSVQAFDSRIRRRPGPGPRFLFLKNENYRVAIEDQFGLSAELICEATYDQHVAGEYSRPDFQRIQLAGIRSVNPTAPSTSQVATQGRD